LLWLSPVIKHGKDFTCTVKCGYLYNFMM